MSSRFTLDTPEAVSVDYEVAGIGTRFLAAVIDSLVIVAVLILIVIGVVALSLLGDTAQTLAIVLAFVLIFIVLWGYYVLYETMWSGQTPGKRAMDIRVIKLNGYPIGLMDSIIRNIVRVVDFLPSLYGVGVVTMFISSNSRRLGDYAAGTIVVKERQPVTVADLHRPQLLAGSREVAPAGESDPDELNWNLHLLSSRELVVMHEFVDRAPGLTPDIRRRVGNEIAVKIADRIGARAPLDPTPFLARVIALYEAE
jgi:uncharacterized RDD family membrane protein YckC